METDERWFAQLEREIGEVRKETANVRDALNAHLLQPGHTGQDGAMNDLRSRITRMEGGIVATLLMVLGIALKLFLPGAQ